MSESSRTPSSTSTACDRCHGRKVKCDKQDPCKTCVAANAVCSRLRHRTIQRKPRPTERIGSLTTRIHELENMLHDPRRGTLIEDLPDAPASFLRDSGHLTDEDDEDEGSRQPPHNLRTGYDPPSPHSAQARSTSTSTTPSGRSQLEIAGMQRVILNKVLAKLGEFAQTPSLQDWSTASRDKDDDKGLYDLTPSDILNIFAASHTPRSGLNWSNAKLATYPSTERFGKVLLRGEAQDDSKTLLYRAILNFQAGMILSRQEKHLKHTMKYYIEHIRIHKFRDVLSKLDQISFRTPPSLHMLQAQCIGIVILQYFGNLPEAWSMLAAASRTFITLGYDRIDYNKHIDWSSDFSQEELDGCVVWCYQLDRSLSLLLRRQPLLPRLSTPPQLRMNGIYDDASCSRRAFIQMNIDFAHIQGEIAFSMDNSTIALQWEDIEPLHKRMRRFFENFLDWKQKAPDTVHVQFERDVLYLDFKYRATETLLLQLPPELANSSLLREQLVESARGTFESFQRLVRDWDKIEMIDMGWDLLLYCLSPLCVLAYNIVRTRNAEDFELLDQYGMFIRLKIIQKPRDNPLATRIDDLYEAICRICEPLVLSVSTNTTKTTTAQLYPTNHTPQRKNFMNFETFFGSNGTPAGSSSNAHGTNQSQNQNGSSATDVIGAQQNSFEDPKETEEQFLKLLMYRVKLGWSGGSLVYAPVLDATRLVASTPYPGLSQLNAQPSPTYNSNLYGDH